MYALIIGIIGNAKSFSASFGDCTCGKLILLQYVQLTYIAIQLLITLIWYVHIQIHIQFLILVQLHLSCCYWYKVNYLPLFCLTVKTFCRMLPYSKSIRVYILFKESQMKRMNERRIFFSYWLECKFKIDWWNFRMVFKRQSYHRILSLDVAVFSVLTFSSPR